MSQSNQPNRSSTQRPTFWSGKKQPVGARAQSARHGRGRGPARSAWFIVGAAVLALVALVLVKLAGTGGATVSSRPSRLVSAKTVAQATGVPARVLSTVGVGVGATAPERLAGQRLLTKAGLPRVVYVGADYCPFCAAQRWALVGALSRFGTFSHLGATTSSAVDVYPRTPTFSFYGSSYHSAYVRFTPIEEATNQPVGSSYQPLQQPTATEQALVNKLDAPPYVAAANADAIPFVDIANRYLAVGSSYSPALLHGQSRPQIAAALSNPASPTAQAVDGAANLLTADICTITHGHPGSVCSSTAVRTAARVAAKAPKVG